MAPTPPPPTVKPKSATAAGGAKAAAGGGPKTEIAAAVRGQVLPRLRQWVPAIAALPEQGLYEAVLCEPPLLHAAFEAFAAHRAEFGDITTGVGGAPVLDNDKPLRCERTVDEIMAMAVRSGARAFARRVLDDGESPTRQSPQTKGLVEKLQVIIRDLWGADLVVGAKGKSRSEQFYDAIRDHLDAPWQVPLFPYYVELPPKLIEELGKGLTTLRSPDGIRELAEIGRQSLDEAKRIVGDELAREMLDANPKAARGVAHVGKDEFERLNACFGDLLQERRWEVFNDLTRLEALEGMDNKTIRLLAPYLTVVGAETLTNISKFLREFYQVQAFLDIGLEMLGKEHFIAVFGNPGRPAVVRKITQKISEAKLDAANPQADFSGRLADVFRAYTANPQAFERNR